MLIDNILNNLIRREGGYVNRPEDRGGPTKYGITLGTLEVWRKKQLTAEDVKALTEEEAKAIYHDQYIKPFLMYTTDSQLMDLIVDSAVNHGPARVRGWLNEITVKSQDPEDIYRHVLRERIKFYGRIITKTPSQAVFAAGWMNRIAEFVR